ncbi:hypothetical protein [Mycolicibacter heraklionensis]|uniref:hypothetical protein n=1 Tax=Mycolicibacter heraklionensis TaxID=512402 RepID=UPI0009E2D39A|nr:hypothetical protein [Mycolicibacter heraklionensis]
MTTREFAKNLFSQWSDDDFTAQPVFDKLLFQVLSGQRAVNAAGVQPINFTRWAKAMRDGDRLPTTDELRAALARMEARRYVFLDEDTGELLIRTRMRNDGLEKQPTVFLSALRFLSVFDSPKFATVMYGELELMSVPEVRGESDHAQRLRTALELACIAAREHLASLAERYEIPNAAPNPIPNRVPNEIPNARPAETGADPIPNRIPNPIPSVSVSGSVSVSNPPTDVGPVGSRERAREAGDGDTASVPGPDDEPPTRCKQHAELPADAEIPNCGPCANFRRANERWHDRQRRRHAQAQSDAAHAAAALKARDIADCTLCDADGYRNGRVCGHNPEQDAINENGSAAARAALAASRAQPRPDDPESSSTPPLADKNMPEDLV